ncbi:SRPBCC domain-containing protein [Dyadobacter psychrotolerans]|uniref:SRPBCC domain-containing protein n=1 Tax=Dyadobacter psychrotolerans TaxID=2541721 RepID=A0A4R5DUN5_9BACT|nr:SRPBCC domain-containing protein [Dyadobacter psychrotolerans]TDE18169.1 SRPBCC domain-containing protein [Dyadobacter psychrotolerans]
MKELIVESKTIIDAPVNKVWEVLIAPKFIRQWDSLPEDFADYYLEVGREIEWSGSSKITVTKMVAHEYLSMSLFLAKWGLSPSEVNISYAYTISVSGEQTVLSVKIGDFGALPEGEEYHMTYAEFAEKVLEKIKALAENRA